MSERESSYERGYRLGRRQGWDLGVIAAYEALPHRLHYEDNPYAVRASTDRVCDVCMKPTPRSDIWDPTDGEHVICKTCAKEYVK